MQYTALPKKKKKKVTFILYKIKLNTAYILKLVFINVSMNIKFKTI